MKTITVCNQKGGVGKTTTSTALAAGLKLRKKKVLLIDCDPQGNSTDTYRASMEDGAPTLADLLFSDADARACIQHTEAGDILAADSLLKQPERFLEGLSAFFRLKQRLSPIMGDYDFIIIDTPPNVSLLLQNALIASDGVIVPITCDRYSLKGMTQFSQTLLDIKTQGNPGLRILGLLVVRYDSRTNLTKEAISGLPVVAEKLGTGIFDTYIRESVRAREAQAARNTLFAWAPDSTTAHDYNDFIDELIRKEIL